MANVTSLYSSSPGVSKTTFFVAVGPISPTKPVNAIQAAIAAAPAKGLSAHFLDMRNGTLDGCGSHPGPFGHWQMAFQAMGQIKSVLGW